ncbi:hypothetical protein CVV70_17985 [Ralstonia solanacearum]|nr:hypothetical protein CCY86_18085 [Ralstonia solanacearum]PNQ32010.1 hypothetical protein CVS51_10775 [Ralstonia solanacearum]PNQ34089.1 hypothetical protein CVV71_20450 [Ralstonia solanacearum]PNQ41125.1 hypothetical protein CVT21_12615 [Ralstonia solanacearum]PNQ46318.1 hypothetical protein CVT22_06515 [Ralstonia solanacearum]
MRAPCWAWLTKPLDKSSAHDDAGKAEKRHVDVIRCSKQMRRLGMRAPDHPAMPGVRLRRTVHGAHQASNSMTTLPIWAADSR